ncbi:hypothetical protein B2K_40415 [Paenibacillus mucilaginosus K02]|uniref:Uncharacterized protein n=1 Tax=Paenibacillus mucilaginosus K02 TaxID=997761 RepID=R9UPS4_9BACL|nr:hypothetical protein B2K_40415 [Paenibacillus mucilaginosus K02]
MAEGESNQGLIRWWKKRSEGREMDGWGMK